MATQETVLGTGTKMTSLLVFGFGHMSLSHGIYNIFNMVLDKMDWDNYLVWRNQFECALIVNKFMKYVNGTESNPTTKLADDTNNSDYATCVVEDDPMLGWIKGIVAKQYKLMLLQCNLPMRDG